MYSKRQLYALGEPFGDSATMRKVGGGRIYGGGGNQQQQPTQTTVQNTNIPDYAQPYVSNMLNAAQAQIFNPSMTGFNAYTPYSNNPQDYVAGFSPLQQQAQSSAANLQTPGQFGAATGLTGMGAMQMGRLGNQMGQAGNMYAQQATNPYATQAYMSPYENDVINQQLAENARQYGIQGVGEQAAATSAGAFGGSREALMNAENTRNQNIQANNITATGLQNAFQNAQQAQQFGANLGLQGQQAQLGALQGQMSGANQLANIGNQQLGAQQSILGTQNQLGAQQQNQQQNVINQAVQNYATAQQYPFMQLGLLNSMLRGLPMQQSSTSMYQAAPSTVSQLGGLGIAGLGAASMYNTATGSHASGGQVTSMSVGGAVPMNMMSDQQLQQVQQNPASSPIAKLDAAGLSQLHGYIHNNPQAGQAMAAPQQMAPRSGVAAIGTGEMTNMAGGGIIAFAEAGEVKEKPEKLDLKSILADRFAEEKKGEGTVTNLYKPMREAQEKEIAQNRAMILPEMATRFGLGLMTSPGGTGGNLLQRTLADVGKSGLGAVQGMTQAQKEIQAEQKGLQAGTIEAAKADQARRDALTGNLINVVGQEETKKIGLAQIAANKQLQLSIQQQALAQKASFDYANLVNKFYTDNLNNDNKQYKFAGEEGRKQAMEDAQKEAWGMQSPIQRSLIGGTMPGTQDNPALQKATAPGAAPAPGASTAPATTSQPVTFTIPAGKPGSNLNAQTLQFATQADLDAFKNSPGFKNIMANRIQ